MSHKHSNIRSWWIAIPGGLSILMIALSMVIMPGLNTLKDLYRNSSYIIMIALALAVPFSRGHVDLSVCGIAAICASCMGLLNNTGLPEAVAYLLGIIIGALVGLLNGCFAMLFRRKNFLLMAAATFCIGLFYRSISLLITDNRPISFRGSHSGRLMIIGIPLTMIISVIILVGVAVLLSFTGGGKKTFSAIYLRNEDRNHNPIVSFLFSGILAAIAAMIMCMRLSVASPTSFNYNAFLLLVLACAGVALPNARESKLDSFLGYLAILPAAIGASALNYSIASFGVDSYVMDTVFAILAMVFIALNALIGNRAAREISAATPERPKTVAPYISEPLNTSET